MSQAPMHRLLPKVMNFFVRQQMFYMASAELNSVAFSIVRSKSTQGLHHARIAPTQLLQCNASQITQLINVNFEVVNRYETNIMNTGIEGLAFLDEVNRPNTFIHLDTYHMNIEEDGMEKSVIAAGDKLGFVHIGESHRGYLGSGNVDFDTFFAALKKINYQGPITFESFSSAVVDPALSNALCVWRNLWSDSDDLASTALSFMKARI
jgi:sugar phosphate isomerase/epimerase